jgi:hypothetical protein
MNMDRATLVSQWMGEVDLDPKSLNSANRLCSFKALDVYDVTIEWPENTDDLFIAIDLMPSTGGELRKKRLERAMEINAYGLETRGSAIGWDSVRDMLVLSYRCPAITLTTKNLNDLVINLIETAQYISDELRFEADVVLQAQVNTSGSKWFEPIRA